jgi:hypothetical protein
MLCQYVLVLSDGEFLLIDLYFVQLGGVISTRGRGRN